MAQLVYKRLARHEGIWRVDGIGPIEARAKLGARTVVYFSGLTEEGQSDPYKKASLNGATLALPVHSASIRNFRVGTIWREGKRIAGAPEIRGSLMIDASQTRLVALEQSVNLNGHWASTVLPERYLCFSGNNRANLISTFYAVVPVVANSTIQWLVVPASELLRFYIGVSSRLLSDTLQGCLGNYLDWGKSQMEDGRPVLRVKQPLRGKEAQVLSRAVASDPVKIALHNVHQHLAMTQANNAPLDENNKRPLVIKADFPFSDVTQLKVSGKRMPLVSKEGKEQWAVFAMEIHSCSHPPGFPGYILKSDDPPGNLGSVGEDGGMAPPYYHPLLEDEDDEYGIEDLPADQRLARLAVLSYSNQFSGFEGLKIEHRRSRSDPSSYLPGAVVDVHVNALTQEDGSHSGDAHGNLGISEFQSHVEQVDRELTLFLEMLHYLRATTVARPWKITTRKSSDGLSKNGEVIAFFPTNFSKRRTWHLMTDPAGNTRPRQVVWVEVEAGHEGKFFYLLEMELRPGENNGQCSILLHTNNFSKLDEATFRELLVLTVIRNRWPDQQISGS